MLPKRSAPSLVHVQRWAPEEVGAWLASVNLGQFAEKFVAQNIGGDVLFDISLRDLQDMGVTTVGDRRRLLKALEALRQDALAGPRPELHVAVLGASPLVHVVGQGVEARAVPLGMIDFRREQDLLRKAVHESRHFVPGGLEPTFAVGTFEALSEVLRLGAIVLTITGHTTREGRILLETETGEAVEFDPQAMLPRMLTAVSGSVPRCIVLSSCYSREAGHAFLRLGARHVVAVERTATVLDSAARAFNATFHHALLVGNTVAGAFRFAVSHVRHSSHANAAEAGKFVLLPEEEPERHEVALFGPGPRGGGNACAPMDVSESETEPRAASKCAAAPPPEAVVGRQRDVWQLVHAVRSSRCVVVCGGGGVGKATLCRGTVAFLEERGRRYCSDGVHTVHLRGLRTARAARARLLQSLHDAGAPVGNGSDAVACGKQGEEPPSPRGAGEWEKDLLPLGERLLVLTSLEELLQIEPRETLRFLQELLRGGPQLRVLLTSRRRLPAELWASEDDPCPLHVHLKSLEPEAAAQLLRRMAPTLGQQRIAEIAGLCGHLPLALKIVGQRLAVASDPLAEANDFIAETKNSPGKRASMLFSQCVAPYVWRTLDEARRSAFTALSLFRGAFDLQGAAAVLGAPDTEARALLSEFQDQCLVEELGDRRWCIPTSVHLVAQHRFAVGAGAAAAGTAGVDLEEATARLVLHIIALLRDVSQAAAADGGKGGAGLEALRAFDRHSADVETALVVAGSSDLFVAMVQLGRDIFETRLGAQRRVEIYERFLGLLMARRTQGAAEASSTRKPAGAAVPVQQLLRKFERAHPPPLPPGKPSGDGAAHGTPPRMLARTVSGPGALPSRTGAVGAAQTVPSTPIARPPTQMQRLAMSDDDEESISSRGGSPVQVVRVPAAEFEPAQAAAAEGGLGRRTQSVQLPSNAALEMLRNRRASNATAAQQASAVPPLPGGVATAATPPPAPGGTVATPSTPGSAARPSRPPRIGRKPPSFVLAATQEDTDVDATDFGIGADTVGEEGGGAGVASLRPGWCHVFTAEHNPRLRVRLEQLLQGSGEGDGPAGGMPGRVQAVSGAQARCDAVGWWHRDLRRDTILVEILLRLGEAYSSLGRYAHAAQLLRKALLRVEDMGQRQCRGLTGERMRAELLGTLSGVLCKQGLWQDAETMLWQARQLAKHAGHEELHTRLTCDLAELYHKYMGNLRSAAQFFKDGLSRRMQTLGLDHLDTASTLNAVGVFSAQRGHFNEAREYITQAERIRRKLLGPLHILVAEALHNLANVHDSLQDYPQAEQCYEHALHIKQKVLPEGHMSIAETQNNLCVLYYKTQKHEQCVGLLRRCLDQCLCSVGEKHASTASMLMNIGFALHNQASANKADRSLSAYVAQLDEAQGFVERSLAVKRSLFHRQHPCIAPCRALLGTVHFSKGEYLEAERHFKAALRISRHHYGEQHPDTASGLFWLGKTRCKAGRVSEGSQDLIEARRISESLASDAKRGGRSPLTQDQVAEMHGLLASAGGGGLEGVVEECDEISSSESTFEPAAEPPTAEAEASPLRRRHLAPMDTSRVHQRTRPCELNLDEGPDSEMEDVEQHWSYGRRTRAASPGSSSNHSMELCRASSLGAPGCGLTNPPSEGEPAFARIMQDVRQSTKDYATAQQCEGG